MRRPMKITIEPTTQIVKVNGHEARVWTGVTETGIPCELLVARIAVPESAGPQAMAAFERELVAKPIPRTSQAFDIRFFLDDE